MTVAVSTLHLERQDDKWVYRAKSEPRGIGRMFSERPLQESVLKVTAEGVHPLSYKADDGTSSTKRDADVVFDWEHNRVTGVYEDAKVDMPMPPGIQDDLSVQIALMVELLRDHTPEKFSLLSGNSVREYRTRATAKRLSRHRSARSRPSSIAVRSKTHRAPRASGARRRSDTSPCAFNRRARMMLNGRCR